MGYYDRSFTIWIAEDYFYFYVMKKLLILILPLFVACAAITSCSKPHNDLRTAQQAAAPDQAIANFTFYKVAEAGESHVAFDVTFTEVAATTVTRLKIYRYPSLLRATLNNPSTGTYTLYDHITLYPTYASSTYYQFELEMKDGSKVLMDKFQVY